MGYFRQHRGRGDLKIFFENPHRMAPKKPGEGLKKRDAKKLVDEKMFGMKNKGKSAKLKKMANDLEASYTKGKAQKPKKKEEESDEYEYTVYRPAQKVPVGVDPKAVLCMYARGGQCKKGDKCKFSHDLAAAGPAQDKEQVQPQAADPAGRAAAPEKICRHYIDALKSKKHGPSWKCPNGPSCPNRHMPPEGYSVKDEVEKEEGSISLEEYIETERQDLKGPQTPMTAELFNRWKAEQEEVREKRHAEEERIKEGNLRLGKLVPSGKDLFVYNPDLFVDDEEALEYDYHAREEADVEESSESEASPEVAEGIEKLKISVDR